MAHLYTQLPIGMHVPFQPQFLLQGKMQSLVHLCTQLNACTLSTKYGTDFWLKSALCYGEEMHHKSKRYQEKNRGGEGENENIYKHWYVHFGMRYHGVKAWSSMEMQDSLM